MSPAFERPAQAGFTLIELLVVLVILALVSAAIPSLVSATMPRLQLREAAREVAANLRAARDQAIRSGHDVTVVFVEVASKSPGHLLVRLPQGIGVKVKTESLTGSSMQRDLAFFGDGTAVGGTVSLTRGKDQISLDVDWLLGRVKVND